MIIPSIDLMGGKAVQLRQGKEKVLEVENPLDLAKEFCKYGEIAVIDLDAALGKGTNEQIMKEICKIAPCRVGGGIRTVQKARDMIKAGAKKIIIGTSATKEFLKELPKEKIIVAIDTKNGFVVNKGWQESTNMTPFEAIEELEDYCSEFLFTNVNGEGMLQGIDRKIPLQIRGATKNEITIAGGISNIEEIKWLEENNMNSQLGMSIYTGKIRLSEAFISLVDFQKNNGLVPTITQEENGEVLMLSFSTPESVKKTLESGRATYYSRSRNKIWVKGETSGNFQKLLSARYDCDRDALLYIVKQKGVACHNGKYACFGDKQFRLEDLYNTINQRVKNPIEGSYTSKISLSESNIKEKLLEEAGEVANYTDRANLIWEIADLAYFTLVLMAKKGITINEIRSELEGRRK
ncbi:MAG TPA: bifunctional phosphoribosyl-AMP cyclohydrolase/phosphoribosyl-ATP diphosphatase HisIE [Candidatus Diapherotrites archaeon]|uniref:1-(5-phosphoribosyl)-5-[(5-phosphoribosylamino)methylideneamino] imidazole-4-carboxamide isomerase n=1 Tax=Candidatus Iainarchaeum sp. TaxID=3101447 RepID=A0A7J4J0R7_9ARCH|nr:bifunctional phosphoribosyl-AMP cyclohydrolase/phosphoribosyl-ATP diphosphatase HisIE [Candidatus Diapherotrites archaeon]